MKVCENCEYPLVEIKWYGSKEMYCFNCAANGDTDYGTHRKQTDTLNSQFAEATRRMKQINEILGGRSTFEDQERASELLDSWIKI